MPNAPLSSSFQGWVTKVGGSKSGGIMLKNPIFAAIVVTIVAVAIFVYMKGMSTGAKLLLAVVINTVYLYLFYAAVRSYATETADKQDTVGLFSPDTHGDISGGHIDFPDGDNDGTPEELPSSDTGTKKVPDQVLGGMGASLKGLPIKHSGSARSTK